jgi:hypothetical protein
VLDGQKWADPGSYADPPKLLCVPGGHVGNLNLDDTLGFFREIVDPNFSDFYYDYQSDEGCDRGKLARVFRKMVNLCLTLNHQADKVAHILNYKSALSLIEEVSRHYPREGEALNVVRAFSNDVKHKSKLDSSFTTRKRTESDQLKEGADLPEWYFVNEGGQKVAVCNSSIDAYLFWLKWFDGERSHLQKHITSASKGRS